MEAGTLRNICILEIRSCEKSSFADKTREADPNHSMGKADDAVEETGESTRRAAGERDPASKEGLSEITSGSSCEQQRLSTTCKDSRNEAKCRRKRELNGSGT